MLLLEKVKAHSTFREPDIQGYSGILGHGQERLSFLGWRLDNDVNKSPAGVNQAFFALISLICRSPGKAMHGSCFLAPLDFMHWREQGSMWIIYSGYTYEAANYSCIS